MRRSALIIILCLMGLRCGYNLRGTGSSLPPQIRKIAVPMFQNQTTRFELDRKLTRGIIDEFVARGRVEIVPDEKSADAVMNGEILNFNANPIAFSGDSTADRYNIRITARIILRDNATGKILFSHPSFIYQEDYEVPEGSDFESVETEAIDKIAEKFARSLISTILEGF